MTGKFQSNWGNLQQFSKTNFLQNTYVKESLLRTKFIAEIISYGLKGQRFLMVLRPPDCYCFINKYETSQAEQGHTRVPSSPSSNWTQSIQQSSNLLDIFY